jgi:hypothetical protein
VNSDEKTGVAEQFGVATEQVERDPSPTSLPSWVEISVTESTSSAEPHSPAPTSRTDA